MRRTPRTPLTMLPISGLGARLVGCGIAGRLSTLLTSTMSSGLPLTREHLGGQRQSCESALTVSLFPSRRGEAHLRLPPSDMRWFREAVPLSVDSLGITILQRGIRGRMTYHYVMPEPPAPTLSPSGIWRTMLSTYRLDLARASNHQVTRT